MADDKKPATDSTIPTYETSDKYAAKVLKGGMPAKKSIDEINKANTPKRPEGMIL